MDANISNSIISNSSQSVLLKPDHITGIALGVSFGIIIFTFLITMVVYWLLIKFNTSELGMNRLILCLISVAVGALLGDTTLNLIPDIFSEYHDGEVKRNKGNRIISSTIIMVAYLVYFILEKVMVLLRNQRRQYEFDLDHKFRNKKLSKYSKMNKGNVILSESKQDKQHIQVVLCPNLNLQIPSENINAESTTQHRIHIPPNLDEIHAFNNSNKHRINRLNKHKTNFRKRIKKQSVGKSRSTRNKTKHRIKQIEVISGEDIRFYGIFNLGKVRTIGYLTLISGGINSFLEGIIIGIVFSTRIIKKIVPTLIAILLGLIPKRVGDAGLLLYSGFTIWGVVFWNTVVNFFILIGTGIGLTVGGIDNSGHYYALSFVAGGFLYIALSEMVPIKVIATGFLNIFLQAAFLILGLGVMYIIIVVR